MKHFVSYQREVDKGKLTTVAIFENLTFRRGGPGLRRSKAFQNSLRRLIYPYQLHVDTKCSRK